MKINITTFRLAAILAVSLLAGCSRHKVSAPTGSWSTDSGETFALQKNGTFSQKDLATDKKTGAQIVTELSGTYKMVDSTHIELVIVRPGVTYSIVYQFSDSGSELSLQGAGSSEIKKYHHAIN